MQQLLIIEMTKAFLEDWMFQTANRIKRTSGQTGKIQSGDKINKCSNRIQSYCLFLSQSSPGPSEYLIMYPNAGRFAAAGRGHHHP